ncbi:MAG: alpha/beta hydrolase [Thermoproteota archaeon]
MVLRRFEISNGGMRIVGVLELPASRPSPAVILMHGYTGDKDEHGRFVSASELLRESGFAAVRFDFRYGKTPTNNSESDGKLSEMTPDRWISDAEEVLKYVAKLSEIDRRRIGVIGLSMGGYAAICASARSRLPKAVVAWSAPAKLRPTRRWAKDEHHLSKFRRACSQFVPLSDCRKISPRPILLIAGTDDSVVNCRNSIKIFEAALEPKTLCLIGGADHVFSRHQDELMSITLGWLSTKLA